MKKMSFLETTIPVGAECLYPTRQDAQNFFDEQLLSGELLFGVGFTNHMEKDLLWLLKTPKGAFVPLWAFERKQPITGELIFFHQEVCGNYIHRHQHNYLLCQDDILGLSIRELAVFADETDIKALLNIMREPFEEIALINVYTSNFDLTPAFTSWIVTKPDNSANIRPTFLEDVLIHRGFDPQQASWDFLEVGDTFYHFNDKYRVDFDPKTGWYFAKVFHNPYMKIYTQNAI